MKVLFFGDIFGRPGREALAILVPRLRQQHQPDFIVANAENAARGKGLTPKMAAELWGLGIDVLTMGNHTFDRKDISQIIDDPRLLRPANYAAGVAGHGSGLYKSRSGIPVAVIQLMGRVYMPLTESPFRAAEEFLAAKAPGAKVILVDMHGEITSEKGAMGWYLDGRVSAVIGTHTHVQTADERVLPGGTAFITDTGMCGPYNSIIGAEVRPAIERFTLGLHAPLIVASGDALVCGCLVDIDESTGRARRIERVREIVPLPAVLPEDK